MAEPYRYLEQVVGVMEGLGEHDKEMGKTRRRTCGALRIVCALELVEIHKSTQ